MNTPPNTIMVPIKIEEKEAKHNLNVDNDPVTISQEMTKNHLTKQTAQLGTPKKTETHNEQEVWRGELNKEKVKPSCE